MSDASFAIPDNVIPTLEFRAGRLLAHSGCNRASGSFRDLGGRLEVTALLATKVGCREPLNQFEIAYYRLLEATPAYRIDQGALVLTAGADRARFTRAADSGAR